MEEYTIAQAAEALGVSKDTIRRRIRKGEIYAEKKPGPYGEMYYIKEQDLAQAAEIIEVVAVSRPVEVQEIKKLFQALHDEIAQLREELEQLRGQLQLQEPKEARLPWTQRVVKWFKGGADQ